MASVDEKSRAGLFRRYRKYLAKGLLPHKLLQMLGSAGIIIQPYYFYREEPFARPPRPAESELAGFEFAEARPEDIDGIAGLDPHADSREEIRKDFGEGRRAFVLRTGGGIVAVTWCNTAEIHFLPCRRPLGGDEAYLYGMQTLYSHRGHDLAPYLRWKCLESLSGSGRTRMYSYSDCLNRSAVRFKEKIGAKILFTGLYLGIRGVGGRNWIIRRNGQVPDPVGARDSATTPVRI